MTFGGAYVYTYHITFRNRPYPRYVVHADRVQTCGAGSIVKAGSLRCTRVGDFHFSLDGGRRTTMVESAQWAEQVAIVRLPIFRSLRQRSWKRLGAGADGDAGYLFLLRPRRPRLGESRFSKWLFFRVVSAGARRRTNHRVERLRRAAGREGKFSRRWEPEPLLSGARDRRRAAQHRRRTDGRAGEVSLLPRRRHFRRPTLSQIERRSGDRPQRRAA